MSVRRLQCDRIYPGTFSAQEIPGGLPAVGFLFISLAVSVLNGDKSAVL